MTTEVALLTGGFDRPYALGLATALAAHGVRLDVVGNDEVDSPEFHVDPHLTFRDVYGSKRAAGALRKAARTCGAYARLLRYACTAKPPIFHILWNTRFQLADRTVAMLAYKALGKRVVLTAHNVNAAERDGGDSRVNRLTLRVQYALSDRIFVHTSAMKQELAARYAVDPRKVVVIPFGLNTTVPQTSLSSADARARLGIAPGDRVILFFGNIGPYKGLDYLVEAFHLLSAASPNYRLLVAGKLRGGCEAYFEGVREAIARGAGSDRVVQHIAYIPDNETEVYFKAADVLALPYRSVSQSGVLFLSYGFGLPVVASDVGSLAADVVEGETGFVCRPADVHALATAIETYFRSSLYRDLPQRRSAIQRAAAERNSWHDIAATTAKTYAALGRREPAADCLPAVACNRETKL